jgi:hypothetical protein
MRSNVERNFGTSSLSGDAILWCHLLRWGAESDYAGAPYNVVVGADVAALPYNLVALARTFHTLSGPWMRVYVSGKAPLAGPHVAFKGEMVRLLRECAGSMGRAAGSGARAFSSAVTWTARWRRDHDG